MYYENQETTATNVARTILEATAVIFQLVVAMTQTGKTACMLAVMEKCFTLLHDDEMPKINPDNIYVITGLSSNDWREQTKDRMPKTVQNNVFHRGELKKLKKRLQGQRDVLIILDEVHIASKKNMTIDKTLCELGYKDLSRLQEQNVNFVEFSATPNRVMDDLKKWGDKATYHVMQPGTGYKGIPELLNGRAFQFEDLYIDSEITAEMTTTQRCERQRVIQKAFDTINMLKIFIETKYTSPRYHIIRTPPLCKSDTVRQRFISVFGLMDYQHISVNSQSEDTTVQEIIKEAPSQHTFIYIKDALRCAVTLSPKTNIGILYERVSQTINDDVIVQGLAGRATGYDVPDDMYVFTNLDSLKRYQEAWENGFNDLSSLTYHGSRSKQPKPTFVHPVGYEHHGIEDLAQFCNALTNEAYIPDYRVYNSFDKIKDAAKIMGYGRGSAVQRNSKTDEGFYTCSILAKARVWKLEEIIQRGVPSANKSAANGKRSWRTYFPCYKDMQDVTSLRYVFIIRPREEIEPDMSNEDYMSRIMKLDQDVQTIE